MRKDIWFMHCFLLLGCFLVVITANEEMKAESIIPPTTSSPPEGNTTYLDGQTWCVANAGVSEADLQNALDWACGLGMADCSPIKESGACFEPNTLLSHASYAFNVYYQQNGNSDVACNFGGTASLTKRDPSYGKCVYASGFVRSSAPGVSKYVASFFQWKLVGGLLLSYIAN